MAILKLCKLFSYLYSFAPSCSPWFACLKTIDMRTILLFLLSALCLQAQTNLLNTNRTFSVTLAWDANTETNLAGYNVYYGTAAGLYTVKTNVGNVTTNRVNGLLKSAGRYYFVVTAYNTDGLESDPSNEVSIAAPRPPTIRVQSVLQASARVDGPWNELASFSTLLTPEDPMQFLRTNMRITYEDASGP